MKSIQEDRHDSKYLEVDGIREKVGRMCREVEVPDVVQAKIRHLQLILCVAIVLPFSSVISPVEHHAHGQQRRRTVNLLLRIITFHGRFFPNM